jgi:predicted  nucleic acid-binding Zn-ribbon protein
MHGELDALLSLQVTDHRIADLERQLEALLPRIRNLERKRQEKAEAIEKAVLAVQVEERRQQELERRIAQHTQLQERNVGQLDQVRNVREAGAATAQLDVTKRIIAEDEMEARATRERIAGLQATVDEMQMELEELDDAIGTAQSEVAEQRTQLETDLAAARSEREGKSALVSRPMLGKYDRIRGRRASALYPVRGQSCGHCDTAIPLHRRSQMHSTGNIEVCEACGVLLYMGTGA